MLRNSFARKLFGTTVVFVFSVAVYFIPQFWTVSASATAPTVLRGHTDSVSSIEISSDGRLIASAGLDRTVRLWDAQTGKAIETLRGHESEVYDVTFSPDNKMLASSGYDHRVILWSVKSGKLLRALKLKSWSVAIAFSPDSRLLAVGSQEGNTVIYDTQTGSPQQTLETGGYVNAIVFSFDGRRLAIAQGDITVWDLPTGQKIKTLEGHQDSVIAVKFSSDNHFLASASRDKTARLWNAETGENIKTFETETPFKLSFSPKPLKWKMPVTSVAFAPDGKTLAMATGRAIHLWDISTGKNFQTLEGHERSVTSIAFAPDGKFLVSGSLDNTVRIWSLL